MADTALAGTLVGGAISLTSTVVATFGMEWIKQRRDARNLAFAFHGGISAILAIVSERRYESHVAAMIAAARTGQTIGAFKVRAQRNYVELYSKNIDRIGMLHPSLAERIPTFYICVNSLLEDIDSMYAGDHDRLSQDELLTFYINFQDLLSKTVNLGRHILALVAEKYPSSSFWNFLPG
ncbi:hypothetical protein [Paraburkholderia dipogonis]|uniref:hypothetical protein n=1 Tax=Paraburkholderia dipogonis TaxID=1211383 RepID=UPI0038BD7548